MLRRAILFAILTLVAGVLGFVGLAGGVAITEILLLAFLVPFIGSLVFGRRDGWSSRGELGVAFRLNRNGAGSLALCLVEAS
jgi:uncharacterized membrane protein YtjA (UPF0391 family)